MSMRNADACIHMRTDRQKKVSRESMPADGVQAAAYGRDFGMSRRQHGQNITSVLTAQKEARMTARMTAIGVRGGTAAPFQWMQVSLGDRSGRKQPEQRSR
jgi:hypothetical protein